MLKVVNSNGIWKIQTSTHIFFGLIPWKKYLQFCDGAADVSGCTDHEFKTRDEAVQHVSDEAVRLFCNN